MKKRNLLSAAAVALTSVALLSAPASAAEIEVEGGLISGVASETPGVVVYKGVPYAAAPVGDLRWKAPQPVEAWEGVKVCDTFSKICPQSTTAYGDFQKEFYSDPYPEMSEDCLYLNVWAPEEVGEGKLPVMVYIHGGGNGSGWGYEIEFDGEGIASRDAILVTINYRLGVFGFMSHPDLSAENNGCSGNYGLMDQVAALKWVKNNIAAFGGDPDNITMFGQSAGAMDVTVLACSEETQGVVNRAILQSGGFLPMFGGTPLATAEENGKAVTDGLGKSIEELRAMSDMELYDATKEGYTFDIAIDGVVLKDSTENIVNEGRLNDISYMIGSNTDEFGGMFASGVPFLGDKQLELGRTPIYAYLFTRHMPGIDDPESTCYGAFHTAECWYVFETLDRCWRAPLLDDADYAFAAEMADYWVNFARTGDPNGETVREWAPYTEDNKNIQELDKIMEE